MSAAAIRARLAGCSGQDRLRVTLAAPHVEHGADYGVVFDGSYMTVAGMGFLIVRRPACHWQETALGDLADMPVLVGKGDAEPQRRQRIELPLLLDDADAAAGGVSAEQILREAPIERQFRQKPVDIGHAAPCSMRIGRGRYRSKLLLLQLAGSSRSGALGRARSGRDLALSLR
jgi:hypothetical protein